MRKYELAIIGAGSAGLAAATKAREKGIKDILIIERSSEPGGILLQCIHNGFGLHYFGEELGGPAYAERWTEKVKEENIEIKTGTMVISLTEDKVITYVNPEEGYQQIEAEAVVLAMGCRERSRGAINIPGERPSGIWAAGTAQRYLNIDGYLPGKKVFILGSGDIGLIMARRMTLEGAEVLGVAEVQDHANGLPRNMQQCLYDFDIPLYLSHTVTDIWGKGRMEGLEISEVDSNMQPIPGTEKRFDCDTLLLSVGLIPENSLTENAGIKMNPGTKGALCDNHFETAAEGIFAAGNVLHVHDLVDFVTIEGLRAGEGAADYIKKTRKTVLENPLEVKAGEDLGYVIPNRIESVYDDEQIRFSFRIRKEMRNITIVIKSGDKELKRVKRPHVLPAKMENIEVDGKEFIELADDITVEILK